MGKDLTNVPLEEVTSSLHLTNEDLQLLRMYVDQEVILNEDGDESLLQAVAREVHTHTRFWLHQDHKLVLTRRGTRPGSSWADVLFGILFAKVLRRRGAFTELGLCPQIAWTGRREVVAFDARKRHDSCIPVQDVVYADDLATCILVRSATELPGAIRQVAGAQLDVLAAHGLRANIGAKKTAAIVAPAGARAKAVRQQVFTAGKGKIGVFREHSGAVFLDAVASYRHLGTVLSHNGSLVPEIRVKLAKARATFKEGRQTVFCSPCIALDRRIILFRSYVLATLFSGSGAWPCLGPAGWRILDSGVTHMVRQMLRIPHDAAQNWTKERIFGEAGLPGVDGLLALERLRFLGQLCRSGPDAAFALMQHSKNALEAMRVSMEWLVSAVAQTSDLRPNCSWDTWTSVLCNKRKLSGLLKRASAWHVGRLQACASFQNFCRRVWVAEPAEEVQVEVAHHMCLLCKIAFFDFHAWSSHAVRSHGYRARAQRFVAGKRCRACGMGFPTALRHRRHLQAHPVCCRAVEWDVPGLFPPVLGPDEHVQAESVPGVGVGRLSHTPEGVSAGLFWALKDGHFDSDTAIFEVIKCWIEPFPMLRDTLRYWRDGLVPGELRDWASDVLLCMQVDLWCEGAARMPRSKEPVQPVFRPLIRPLVLSGSAEVPSWVLIQEVKGRDPALPNPATCSACLDFWQMPPEGLAGVGVSLSLPSPPVSVVDMWCFASCPLRVMRRHASWLHHALTWIDFLMARAATGVPCVIQAPFSRGSMGVLADWMLTASQLSQGHSSLELRFTF